MRLCPLWRLAMLKGTNLELAKVYNLRIVLETVRRFGPMSRADIARRTELTPQTITNIVPQLCEQDLVVEVGRKQGKRGSPAIMLEFNPEGAFVVGLDVDREHLTGVVADLTGVVHQRLHQPVYFPSPAEALKLMANAAETLMQHPAVRRERIWGVGVGFPGPLRINKGSIVDNVVNPDFFPGWSNVPVVDELTRRLNLPVYLENNATAAAMGESFYGAGQNFKNFFYVFLGIGLGGGIILNGHPYDGFQGNAGELGFFPIVKGADGRVTQLGTYFNLPALYRQLREAGVPIATPNELEPLMNAQHPVLMHWLETGAGHLARALVIIEYTLDPEAIIVGGCLPAPLVAHLVARLEELMRPLRIAQKTYRPRLVCAQAGADAAALGVATLPIYNTLSPNLRLLLNENGQSPLAKDIALAVRR